MVKRYSWDCGQMAYLDENGVETDWSPVVMASDYDTIAARLAEVASIAHDGGLRGMSEADALVTIRRLTLPHWNKSGGNAERVVRVADSADDEPPTCKWCGKAFYTEGNACRTCVPDSADAGLAKFAADLAAAQTELPPEAARVLYERRRELYLDGTTQTVDGVKP